MPAIEPIDTTQERGGTKMTENANAERVKLFAKNDYDEQNKYSSIHPDALADGDDKGRGTGNYLDSDNFDAGTGTEIVLRNQALAVNPYSRSHTYPDF